MNNINMIGRSTKDCELRTTTSGKSVATFSIAVNRRYKRDEADFFNCVVWGKLAEICGKFIRKGSQVGISGEIQNRSYEGKDGNKRYMTEIIASEVEFIGKKSEKQEPTNSNDVYEDNDLPMPF